MKIECTKREFANMIIACNESQSCYGCALKKVCGDKEKGELIGDIVEIVPEEEKK